MFDLEKASRGREVIQKQAVILSQQYDNLLLSWATGTSKTKATIEIIEHLYAHDVGMMPKTYILLKETNHEQNWRDEFKKWGREHWLQGIKFFCYASLHKYINDKVDILILDECHALSEMREDYLKTIKCDKIISLSATILPPIKERIENYKSGFYEYHISLQEAIDLGILPEPSIKVVYIDLDDRLKNNFYKFNSKKSAMVTQKQYYIYLQAKIDMWEKKYLETGEQWVKNKWIQAMGMRKKFMAGVKTDPAKLLLQYLADKRYICFTGSIEQCTELGAEMAIHSKVDSLTRSIIMDDFNSGKTKHIYAVNMLRESMNLNNIEAGIIVQLDNQVGSFYQMTGRALRSLAPEVYILVLRGTKDEDYFDKVTRDISSQYISEYTWPKDE